MELWWLLILLAVGYGAWAYWRVWSNRRNVLAEMASVEQDMSAHEGLTAPVQQSIPYVIHHTTTSSGGACAASKPSARCTTASAEDALGVVLRSLTAEPSTHSLADWSESKEGAISGRVPGSTYCEGSIFARRLSAIFPCMTVSSERCFACSASRFFVISDHCASVDLTPE